MTDMGYHVFGNFDVGSKQRKKLTGITDHNTPIDDFETIILHQVPDYARVMREHLDKGRRVILSSFGQADTWQYVEVGRLCQSYPKAYVSAYAIKEYNKHIQHGAPANKVRMIRFAKYLEDFQPWEGSEPIIYASCNSIHLRGEGCKWHLMEQCMKELPIVLSGKETEQVGGLGEISEEQMHGYMSRSAGFLSFGTAPAPLVLTQIESWVAGCPTAIYNNECGIAGEGMHGIIENSVPKLIEECRRLIDNEDYRASRHRDSLLNATHFNSVVVAPQWEALLQEVMSC